MLKAIQPMLDSGIINEDVKVAINEAWEQQITEAREQMRAELREEFAQRYQHDKSLMVEALDKMVTESLSSEIAEFREEKQALAEDRVKFKRHMTEGATKFNKFMTSKLAEEIQELRKDRQQYENSIKQLESFVIKALSEEIHEFEQDKRAVVETKVKLVAEAKTKMAQIQKSFIQRSAGLVKEAVAKKLETELTQLKEDIQLARENMFGRRLFEAFASEFAVTHLNENKEIAKLQASLSDMKSQLAESQAVATKAAKLVESREREIRMIKESAERKSQIADLLKPLNAEKQTVMRDLLEGVQTDKLQAAFEKYLPAVLNGGQSAQKSSPKAKVLTESRKEVTGDKAAIVADENETNVVVLKRLAGLK